MRAETASPKGRVKSAASPTRPPLAKRPNRFDAGDWAIRWIRTALVAMLAALMTSAAYMSITIVNQGSDSSTSSHYAVAGLASDASGELQRLRERLQALSVSGNGGDKGEIKQRVGTLGKQLQLLRSGPAGHLIEADPELGELLGRLDQGLANVLPLTDHLEQPQNRAHLAKALEPLEPDLARLTMLANQRGGIWADENQREQNHLHAVFAWLLIGVCVCALALLGIVTWIRQRFVAQLLVAKETAEAANLVRSRFLANMSHELRTPMNGVLGMIELIKQGGLTEEQGRFADIAHQSAKVTLDLIGTILDFSRLETGRLVLEEGPVDVGAIVNDVIGMMRAEAITKGLTLSVTIAAGLPIGLLGDAGRLRQILSALVGNAIKFTQGGEITLSVVVEARTGVSTSGVPGPGATTTLRFEVIDTGIGIPAGQVSRIFEAFSQADTSSTRQKGGAGLGLTMARQLVELMEGEIGVSSQQNRGSTFWFTVPFRQEKINQLTLDPGPVSGLSVLLVAMDGPERAAATGFLTEWGINPLHADTAGRAITLTRRARSLGRGFDQLFVSQRLPDMSGEELVQIIWREAPAGSIAITMIGEPRGAESGLIAPIERVAIYEALSAAAHNAAARTAKARDEAARTSAREAAARAEADRASGPRMGIPAPAPGERPPEPSKVETGNGKSEEAPPIRVLLVEDNPVNRMIAREFLKRAGCSVDMAKHGREAVDHCLRHDYDIIFMDCQMPEMDGFEATRAIRDQQTLARHRVPIVALTANAMEMDREQCIQAGMDDFLVKPANQTIIADALKKWVPRGGQA